MLLKSNLFIIRARVHFFLALPLINKSCKAVHVTVISLYLTSLNDDSNKECYWLAISVLVFFTSGHLNIISTCHFQKLINSLIPK